jgi:hypothetical protein
MSVKDRKNTTHRFADVAGEPCRMLAPIEGFRKKPLVTLEEAIAELKNIVPRIDTYAHVAKERAKNPANGLSVDESASIALYTMDWEPYTESLYCILNSTLRTEDRQSLKPWFLYLKLILTALSGLPPISHTVYRGVRTVIESQDEKYQIGKKVVWWGFSSCSDDRKVSEKEQFLGEASRGTLFIIDCINGRDIANHSYFRKENEILLLPATQFQVISNEHEQNGPHKIHLKEIKSSFILLEPVSSKEEIEAFKKPSVSGNTGPGLKSPVPEPERYCNPKLTEYIVKLKSHAEVFLIGKRYNENDIEIIVKQIIIEKQCRELFLRESGITSQGAMAIAEGLHGNKTLERLFISSNTIGDNGAKALAQSLSGNNNLKLRELCLGNNNITDEGVEYLANMLESNKTLTHLYLHSNSITDHGLKRLAEVITNTNKTLQVLALEWNTFSSDSSGEILAQMLNKNQSLTALNLNSCKLSKTATKHLKAAAKSKKKFELSIH